MIVHIDVGVKKINGKWIGCWKTVDSTGEIPPDDESNREILANRREELERKMDKALRLAFPFASYIVQHRSSVNA